MTAGSSNSGVLSGWPPFIFSDEVGLCVNGGWLEPRARSRGGVGGRQSWVTLAAEHALQERCGLDQAYLKDSCK